MGTDQEEIESFKCGQCGKPVVTRWAPNHGGLLPGDYVLFGDVMFHCACLDEYLKECPP
jgi:hypothetical protein